MNFSNIPMQQNDSIHLLYSYLLKKNKGFEMEKTFSKIKTLKSRRKLSLPAAASPLMNNAGHHGEANHDTVMHFVRFLSGQSDFFMFCGQGVSYCLGMNYYVNFLGGIGSNGFHIK